MREGSLLKCSDSMKRSSRFQLMEAGAQGGDDVMETLGVEAVSCQACSHEGRFAVEVAPMDVRSRCDEGLYSG